MKSKQKFLGAVLGSFTLLSGCADIDSIHTQVINDTIAEYNIAKRHGNLFDACAHAGIVAAAYLQAQDESNYAKWKRQEREDCKAAEGSLMRELGL